MVSPAALITFLLNEATRPNDKSLVIFLFFAFLFQNQEHLFMNFHISKKLSNTLQG